MYVCAATLFNYKSTPNTKKKIFNYEKTPNKKFKKISLTTKKNQWLNKNQSSYEWIDIEWDEGLTYDWVRRWGIWWGAARAGCWPPDTKWTCPGRDVPCAPIWGRCGRRPARCGTRNDGRSVAAPATTSLPAADYLSMKKGKKNYSILFDVQKQKNHQKTKLQRKMHKNHNNSCTVKCMCSTMCKTCIC